MWAAQNVCIYKWRRVPFNEMQLLSAILQGHPMSNSWFVNNYRSNNVRAAKMVSIYFVHSDESNDMQHELLWSPSDLDLGQIWKLTLYHVYVSKRLEETNTMLLIIWLNVDQRRCYFILILSCPYLHFRYGIISQQIYCLYQHAAW